MEEKETNEIIKEFHRNSKKVKGPKQKTQSQEVLSVCGTIIMILAVIAFLVLLFGYNIELFVSLATSFGIFVLGLTLYVIAKICTVLIEIRDKI